MPINANNAYRYSQIKKRQLTAHEIWLTHRLNELKTTITLQTDPNENQPELPKQNNLIWFQQDDTLCFEQNIRNLNRQIDAHLDQISNEPIRDKLKKTLSLPQIKGKLEESISSDEDKQNLRKAIFHYLIQFDPKNPTKKSIPRIISDKKLRFLIFF